MFRLHSLAKCGTSPRSGGSTAKVAIDIAARKAEVRGPKYVRHGPRLIKELEKRGQSEEEWCASLGQGHSISQVRRAIHWRGQGRSALHKTAAGAGDKGALGWPMRSNRAAKGREGEQAASGDSRLCDSRNARRNQEAQPREAELEARAAELERYRGSRRRDRERERQKQQPPSAVAAHSANELGPSARRLRCPAVCDTTSRFCSPDAPQNKGRPIRFKRKYQPDRIRLGGYSQSNILEPNKNSAALRMRGLHLFSVPYQASHRNSSIPPLPATRGVGGADQFLHVRPQLA